MKYPKKIFALLSATMVFTSIFCGCGSERRRNVEEMMAEIRGRNRPELTEEDTDKIDEIEDEYDTIPVEPEYSIEDLDEAYQTILGECTSEFIAYHPVDETFLSWLSQEYGSDCVLKVANELRLEEPDNNIWYELTGNTMHVLWLLYCAQTGFQQYQLENVKWKVCASMSETTLEFTGDVNFAEGYVTTVHMDQCKNGIYDCFSEDLLEEMNQADVMMVNNEFTYSTRGTAIPEKAYTFRAKPERVELMKVLGTDIVNIANNHVCDFGFDALLDTVDTLDGAGIPHVGAGANIEEASKPYYFVCNGRKIAIVSATQIERTYNYTKEATETTPGVLKSLNPAKFVEVIKKAKKNSDYVIVNIHWGTEGDSNYGKDQESLAKAYAAAGADAIIGGHTHCLQGFDFIDGVPVIYSLGNFWFSNETQDTGLAKVTIDEEGELTLSFIPCIQQNTKTSLVTEESEKKRILEFMQMYSSPKVVVNGDGTISEIGK